MSLRTVFLGTEPRQQVGASQTLLALAVYRCFAAERYDLRVELLHLFFAGIVLAACAALAIRIGRLRTGLTEHIAGESVAQTVERTDRALYDAKAQGRNRTVAA